MEVEECAGVALGECHYCRAPLGKLERVGIGTVEIGSITRFCYLETREDFGVIIHSN